MKKVLLIAMFSFIVMLGFSNTIKAEGEIELYPYDNIACLQALSTCPNTKVGDSNWSFTYYGHTYFVIKDLVRYGHEMEDINSDGFIDDSELAGIPYNAFASVFMNNTASEIIVKTANARTDITDVVHRKYAYFNETGELAMFEDHISTYYIFNDGDATTPDWRMASQAEIDAYLAEVAAETITAGAPSADGLTRKTHIRIALDAVDTDGYVVEPLSYLKWTNADVDTTTVTDVTLWSTIIADDPNNVVIPAGWTVVSFGTNDRGTVNTKTRDFIEMLPAALAALTTAPATFDYVDQPAWFNGLTALDDDAGTPGINVVVDYNGTFELPATIESEWKNMFDDSTSEVINSVEKLDYTVVISQDGVDLETITYTWNETTEMYDASAAQTVVDSSVFGSGYVATYSTTSPEGDITTQEVDIVIGVMPPKFAGIEDRYINEGVFVDLLEGVTADDGYANDVTDSIMVTTPGNFNMYNPLPGQYTIELEFSHHVHFDGVPAVLEVNGVAQTWDGVLNSPL
ncbi:MAG: hypothetical protein KJ847_00205, partial [Firmicutes bacterium]|nr:hypothetical protein [Bacillota bacterium]